MIDVTDICNEFMGAFNVFITYALFAVQCKVNGDQVLNSPYAPRLRDTCSRHHDYIGFVMGACKGRDLCYCCLNSVRLGAVIYILTRR